MDVYAQVFPAGMLRPEDTQRLVVAEASGARLAQPGDGGPYYLCKELLMTNERREVLVVPLGLVEEPRVVALGSISYLDKVALASDGRVKAAGPGDTVIGRHESPRSVADGGLALVRELRTGGATQTEVDAAVLAALNAHKTGGDHDARYYDKATVDAALAAKQAVLVSGSTIKTLNGVSLLGAGDIPDGGAEGGSAAPLTCHELRILGPSYYAWIGAVLRWGESGLIIEPPSSMSAGTVTLNMMGLELYGAAYFYGGPISFFSAGTGIEGPLDISASASTSSKLDLLLTYLASAGLVHMTP